MLQSSSLLQCRMVTGRVRFCQFACRPVSLCLSAPACMACLLAWLQGGLLQPLHAVESLLAVTGRLPLNVKVCLCVRVHGIMCL